MSLRLFIVIFLSTVQVFASKTKTAIDGATVEVHNNNTIVPRQSSSGLITFEGQANPTTFDDTGEYTHGVLTFGGRPSNLPFRFEDQNDKPAKPSSVDPEIGQNAENSNQNHPSYHEKDSDLYQEGQTGYGLVFQDDNGLESQYQKEQGHTGYDLVFQDDKQVHDSQNPRDPGKRKRRRRRRKPKQLAGPGYGFAAPGFGSLARPGPPPTYPGPLPDGTFYRPPRRQRTTYAEEALASITTALTSIARHDDLQCVPRLLCEVAGGQNPVTGMTSSGGIGSGTSGGTTSGLLQSVVNLQPLVTLLAAYNGVSTSPLFVFGRAALLGMTSKGNAGNCRYAYPQCPTDTEQLVEYLNNHNGGFFRFFNNPQPYGQQNLEQFYSQLSGNYGLYKPQGDPGLGYQSQGGFGFSGPYQQQPLPGSFLGPNAAEGLSYQGYGQYHNLGGIGYPNSSPYQGYGYKNPFYNKYGLYQGSQQKYGLGYPYKQGHYKNSLNDGVTENEIQKRIQNHPDITYVGGHELNANAKWAFPDSYKFEKAKYKQRFGRTITFPQYNTSPAPSYEVPHTEATYIQQNINSNKKAKGFNFPEDQSNRQYIDYFDYPPYTQILDNNNFKLDEQGFYVESDEETDEEGSNGNKKNEDDVELVYVLRGNGDPNKPEIIKLKPGQKIK